METQKQAIISIFQNNDWSFQRGIVYANWIAPGQVGNQGTSTVTPFSPMVTLSTGATMQMNTYLTSVGHVPITTLQYRDPQYSIYNIIGQGLDGTVSYVSLLTSGSGQNAGLYTVPVMDNGPGMGGTIQILVNGDGTVTQTPVVLTSGSGYLNPYINFSDGGTPATFQVFQNLVLTLDRPWMEPTQGGGQSYMIYQAYFVAPVQYFSKFIEMRDTSNGFAIDFWSKTQSMLSEDDSQRLIFADPEYCVAAGVDTRPNSSTPNWQMFELWPQQLSYQPYSFSYRSLGPVPESQQDFLSWEPPYPITYEMIEWYTKLLLYQFKEAQRDKTEARGSGSNWMMLAQYAQKQYAERLDKIMAIDLNLNNEAYSRTSGRNSGPSGRPYANRLGGLNIGSYPDSGY